MMNRLLILGILLVLLYLMFGCAAPDYYYARVGVGVNGGNYWEDQDNLGGYIAAGQVSRIDKNWYIELGIAHYSQPLVGDPVNNEFESSSYHLYEILEYRF